jgi:hypothetical protein
MAETTNKDVSETLRKAITDLEAANIEVPVALYLAILALRHAAVDDRRKS